MLAMYANPLIKGFTTNPTLMRKAGVPTTRRSPAACSPRSPIGRSRSRSSPTISRAWSSKAARSPSWGNNVNVKIPVTNTAGVSTAPIIERLSRDGVELNITAIMTTEQVAAVAAALAPETPAIISVFAGRVADTGIDPMPHMRACLAALKDAPEGGASVGEPARAPEHLPGRPVRLPHHHCDQ